MAKPETPKPSAHRTEAPLGAKGSAYLTGAQRRYKTSGAAETTARLRRRTPAEERRDRHGAITKDISLSSRSLGGKR